MATTSRKDFDAELRAWLATVSDEQSTANLYAELWQANVEAQAIKDPNSPAAAAVHDRINAILARIEAL
jgi:hypothetical protein